jgi:hypothetical protein
VKETASAALGASAPPTISRRSPLPSATSTEFEAPSSNIPEEVTKNTVTAGAGLAMKEPLLGHMVEEPTGAEAATVPRPRPQRPVLDSDTSSGRDTPTEMYVKDSPDEEDIPSEKPRDRDTPTTAFNEPIGGPRDRAFIDTMQSPFSPAEGKMEAGESVQGTPFDVPSPLNPGDNTAEPGWTPHRTGSNPSLPTLTPRGLQGSGLFNVSSPNVPAPQNPLLSTIPIPRADILSSPAKEKPNWQVVLDRALVNTGNVIEDKVRRFRAAPKRTQMVIGGVAGVAAFVVLILLVRWLFGG